MNYQKIRAKVENPLLTAFGALSPAVPVFFDNITAAPANSTTEYVRVNVTFGLTNDATKGTTGTYLTTGSIEGPSFSSTETPPMFMGRIETSYVATVLS